MTKAAGKASAGIRVAAAALVLAAAGTPSLPAFAMAPKTPSSAGTSPARSANPNLPLVPKPGVGSKEEAAFVGLLDNAIAPVAGTGISAEEAAALRDAVKAIAAANPSKGMELKAKVQNPTALKIIDWVRLRSGYGEPQEFDAFLSANPDWPDRALLNQRLEEALFTQGGSSSAIRTRFKSTPPQTGVGMAALASAYLAEGNEAMAAKLAADAWRQHRIPATLETGFLERFGKLLTAADHKARLDRLLIDELRYAAERNARAAYVKRLAPLLPPDEQKKAAARLAVFMQAKNAKTLMDASPAGREPDWGLEFQRIQMLRRAGHAGDAARLLQKAPLDVAKTVVPDSWWDERRANAYLALKTGNPKLAYELVRQSGELSVNPAKEQRFMAGWIALRYLKDVDAAKTQFEELARIADGPLSRAKAAYWLGRTAEAKGDRDSAQTYYDKATRDPDTFHGQLAAQKLKPGPQAIAIKLPAVPDQELVQRFNDHDAVKATVIARKAGLDAYILRNFIVQLRSVFDSEPGYALVAHLSEAIGDTQMAVRTAKTGIAARRNLLTYAYPVHPFPAYTALRTPPETAFVLGIARQETEFNNLTVSGAGAKGLLQVMTQTAKHVCHDYKVKCDIPRLISDPAYNAMISSAYIGDRLDDFGGSYVLTLAGYNAGPGRARQWIAEFGDPRSDKIDPIDWIERIPIQETREYVAKVLSNIQVYRARLGEGDNALRLEQDLMRARSAHPPSLSGEAATGNDPGEAQEARSEN